MKQFLFILVVICALIAGAWYGYDPYLKPLLEGDGAVLSGEERVVKEKASTPAEPAHPVPLPAAGAPKAAKAEPAAREKSANPAADEPKSEIDRFLEEPLEEIVGDWKAVPRRAFPDSVVSSEPIAYDLVVNGQKIGSSTIAPGTPLKPVRLEGETLVVAGPSEPVRIPVTTTDFQQRIRKRYEDFVAAAGKRIAEQRGRARQVLEDNPDRLAELLDPEKASTAPSVPQGDPRFVRVKQSLANGDVASARLEEAKSFHWNGAETVGGAHAGTYDPVTVKFAIGPAFRP